MRLFFRIAWTALFLWDADAMRPHILQHSWLTLFYVWIMIFNHIVDFTTMSTIHNHLLEE